jgi:ribonuclease PH
MTASGEFVELQATGERTSFSRAQMDSMIELGAKGVAELIEMQEQALAAS